MKKSTKITKKEEPIEESSDFISSDNSQSLSEERIEKIKEAVTDISVSDIEEDESKTLTDNSEEDESKTLTDNSEDDESASSETVKSIKKVKVDKRGKLTEEVNSSLDISQDENKTDLLSKTRLFITGLNYDSRENDLRELFEQFGELKEVAVIMNREKTRNKGFGYLEFNTPEEATAAIKLNGTVFMERPLIVEYAKTRMSSTFYPVYVNNIPFSATKEDITDFFKKFGKIHNVSVPIDSKFGDRGRGFAFVEFSEREDALKVANKKKLVYSNNRPIYVKMGDKNPKEIGGSLKRDNSRFMQVRDGGSGRFEKRDGGSGRFEKRDGGSGRFEKRDGGSGRFEKRDGVSHRFEKRDGGSGRFEKRDGGSGRFEKRDSRGSSYDKGNRNSGKFNKDNDRKKSDKKPTHVKKGNVMTFNDDEECE